jgi:hypothetical protein
VLWLLWTRCPVCRIVAWVTSDVRCIVWAMAENSETGSKKQELLNFYRGLSPRKRVGIWALLGVELVMNALTQRDLTRRRAAEVRGPKLFWRLIAMLNFIGPAAYFAFGRRRSAAE